ncbi:MAG: TolC family protein, partial [Bacillota bacterium]|nr:TolC family protein [Bacillota bacterium]
LPQFSLSAKATYQSDVTKLPISLPGIKIEGLNKEQYQAVAEVDQTLWDGGMISSQKKITQASTEIDRQKTEVDLYALKDRVNQLYFGILSLNAQLVQNDLLLKELQTDYDKFTAYIQSGIANQSDLDVIKVEQLKTRQHRTELLSARKAYKEMLEAMIGSSIPDAGSLQRPDAKTLVINSAQSNRPELKLFEAQNKLYDSQTDLIKAGNMPKISLFVQGGLGNPGLNMLKNELSTFYIGGARLVWNFGNFYTRQNNLRQIELNKQSVDVQKETFLYNNNLKIMQQEDEIEKIREQIAGDDEIIALRGSIKVATEVKVKNGTQSVTDLVQQINAESQAAQNKSLHEIQLVMAIYNLKTTVNNY